MAAEGKGTIIPEETRGIRYNANILNVHRTALRATIAGLLLATSRLGGKRSFLQQFVNNGRGGEKTQRTRQRSEGIGGGKRGERAGGIEEIKGCLCAPMCPLEHLRACPLCFSSGAGPRSADRPRPESRAFRLAFGPAQTDSCY